MKYKIKKRNTAIVILKQICNPLTFRITGIKTQDSYQEINEKFYDIYELKDLKINNKFSQELFRDAVDLLTANGHIEIFENEKNIYDIRIRILKKGAIALTEDFYQNEISEYYSNVIFRWTKIVFPFLAIASALATLVVSGYK